MCSKLATGAGKTVVMAMFVTWAFCNRGRTPSDARFPRAALICCPNLTIKERLQVLRTDSTGGDYYTQFEMVPPQYTDLIRTGKVLVTNWHAFAPESEHAENGKNFGVVNKGPESDEAFAMKRLGELAGLGPILCLNDEAHHAYRPRPAEGKQFIVTFIARCDRTSTPSYWTPIGSRRPRFIWSDSGASYCITFATTGRSY